MEPAVAGDDLETVVDAVIATCDGNVRAAIRTLLLANNFLHADNERLRSLTSRGFHRGVLSLLDLP